MARRFQVGPFVFGEGGRDIEIPEHLGPLGVEQMDATHQFVGGARLIQPFGPMIPDSIEWSGIMLGPDAEARAFALQAIAAKGEKTTLISGPWNYYGLLKRFHVTSRHQWRLDYQAAFKPEQDRTNGTAQVPPTPTNESIFKQTAASTNARLQNDALQPVPLFPTSLNSLVTGTISSVLDVLRKAGGLLSQIAAGDLTGMLLSLSSTIGTLGSVAGEVGAAASPYAFSTPAALFGAAAFAEDCANNLRYMRFAATQPGPLPRVLTLVNPNLYELAAQYLGGYQDWTLIANASGLSDPMPIGKYRVTIPQRRV